MLFFYIAIFNPCQKSVCIKKTMDMLLSAEMLVKEEVVKGQFIVHFSNSCSMTLES